MNNNKIREQITNSGFKVTSNIGYMYGEQCIVSYTASKGHRTVTRETLPELLDALGASVNASQAAYEGATTPINTGNEC